MCGRYAIQMGRAEIEQRLRIHGTDTAVGSVQYNLPPGTLAPVVLPARDDPGVFTIESCFWGFVPSWKNDALRAPINARLDKRHSAFWRKAFARRRCLIPGNWCSDTGT
jgi:putative SOS response-associated peptidase YedK